MTFKLVVLVSDSGIVTSCFNIFQVVMIVVIVEILTLELEVPHVNCVTMAALAVECILFIV